MNPIETTTKILLERKSYYKGAVKQYCFETF